MKKSLLLVLLTLIAHSTFSQKLPCSNPAYRQFDFWIGDWDAFGINGTKAGNSKISLILDSCIVLEEWVSATTNNNFRYSGKSYNTYNNSLKQWQQTWVDNIGNTTFFTKGIYSNNSILYLTEPFEFIKDSMAIRKLSFFNINANTVRQLGEISKDNGRTWVTEYDLEYRRKQENPEATITLLFNNMTKAYNTGKFEEVANYYTITGKVVGNNVEISGKNNLITYWKSFSNLGGSWQLIADKVEKIGEQFWVKGKSIITDKNKKKHQVSFTLILVKENENVKIVQDTYW
ncbi:MAG: nuclear transport factor 2 family protein [Chitinophagaceae bacterium]|nr:nuclear transport factor 2 family protein [Chitinophagaceae bacterium]